MTFLIFSQPKIAKMHQRIEKYQKTLKSYDEERVKVISAGWIDLCRFLAFIIYFHVLFLSWLCKTNEVTRTIIP